MYLWNSGLVYGTKISWSVFAIIREFTNKGKGGHFGRGKSIYHFEKVSLVIFIKRGIFNILVSDRRLIQSLLHNKDKKKKYIDT